MIALAGSGDITAACSNTSHMGEPVNRSLLKWKQVKLVRTRITVVRRFAGSYRAKSFQCAIAPGLAAASPQLVSKVKNQGGSKTTNLSTGALFSPKTPVQDAPKQKAELRTSEKKNGKDYISNTGSVLVKPGDVFKDHLALSALQLVLTFLTFKIVKEPDSLDEAICVVVIVTVITLASRQEGTTATYNLVVRIVSPKVRLFLLCLGILEKSGVNAQADSDDGKLKCPNDRTVELPYIVKIAACTFMAIIAVNVIARRINRRPFVTAAAPPPLPVPAIPIVAAAPPAVPAPAIPIVAAAPPAVPVPAIPIVAGAPPAVPAPAIPIVAVAPPAVPAPAIPIVAVAPPAVPAPAIPLIGFINVMHALEDNPAAARISDSDFHIRPPLE